MNFYYNSPLIKKNIYIRYWNNDKTRINFDDNYNIFIVNNNSVDISKTGLFDISNTYGSRQEYNSDRDISTMCFCSSISTDSHICQYVTKDNFTIEEKEIGIVHVAGRKYRFKYYDISDISNNMDGIIKHIIKKSRQYGYISIYTDNPINVIYLYTQIIKTLSNATLNDIIDDINANYYYRINEYEPNNLYIIYATLKAKGRKCKQTIYTNVDDKYSHLLPNKLIEYINKCYTE